MKENKDQYLEKLVDNLMKHDRLQMPSEEFTLNIMEQIEGLQQSKATVYKPLISKPVWAAIGLCVAAIAGIAIFGSNTSQSSWMPEINYSTLFNTNLKYKFPEIKFYSTIMYTMVFLVLMLGIQIPMIKNFYEKSLNKF